MITCEVHDFDVGQEELVVTVMDDGVTIIDHLNIGLPLNEAGKPDLAELRRVVSGKVERFRQEQREATE